MWYTNQQIRSYELMSLRVAFIARLTSYELFLLYKLWVIFCVRVTSYCLLHELQATFYIRVTSYCLLHELQITFIARLTSYCLLHELRVTFYMRVTSCNWLHKLWVTFWLWVATKISVVLFTLRAANTKTYFILYGTYINILYTTLNLSLH